MNGLTRLAEAADWVLWALQIDDETALRPALASLLEALEEHAT
jgi:NADPH-dependent ferric siderophore reductase